MNQSCHSQPLHPAPWRGLCLALLAGLLVRLVLMLFWAAPMSGDEHQYFGMGAELHDHQRFALHGELTAHRPPLYPWLLAPIAGLERPTQLRIVRGFQYLLSWGCLAVWLLWLRQQCPEQPGLVGAAAVLMMLLPSWLHFPGRVLSEVVFGCLWLGSTMLVIKGWQQGGRRLELVLSGVLLGLACLTRSVLILYPPVVLLVFWLMGQRLRFTRNALVWLVAMILTIAPWTLRNALVLDAFVPVNTMRGIVLFQSAFPDPRGFGYVPHDRIGELTRGMTEVERDRYLTEQALTKYRQHPLRTLRLAMVKLAWLLTPWDGKTYGMASSFNPFTLVVMLLAAGGVVRLWRERRCDGKVAANCLNSEMKLTAAMGLASIIYLAAIATLFYGSPRFRMPVEPWLVLLAGIGWAGIMRWSAANRERVVVMVLAVCCVLYLSGDSFKDRLRDTTYHLLGYQRVMEGQ